MLVAEVFAIPSHGDGHFLRQPESLGEAAEVGLPVIDFRCLSFQLNLRQGHEQVRAQADDLVAPRIDPSQALGKSRQAYFARFKVPIQSRLPRSLREGDDEGIPAVELLASEKTKRGFGLIEGM